MDFLKAEIERKKRQISEKNVMQPEKKYFKRGDLVAVQEKEYLAKFGCKETPVTAVEGEGAKGKDPEVIHDDLYPLPRPEVIRRFREVLQPILLFGETEDEANLRLRSLEIVGDSDKLGGTSQNDYREAMKRVDKQYLKSIEADKILEEGEEKQTFESKMYTTDKTYEDLLNMVNDLRRGNLKHDDIVIAEWIKVVMTMWHHELNSRSDEERMCVKGKMDAATFTQTKRIRYLRWLRFVNSGSNGLTEPKFKTRTH
ncbi:pre-mRNA-splicing factor 18-like isoform X2 [Eurytemora carolleeae]|uniref:pre-mRNA-splicing factor 18-like isoform X2 n=1 Tax=Eurytemora carolleeae TaxID=1294199 RepID=UPI000C75F3A7|nr:pre-mRNA-splicing factor 18-like isoform X2 [Eurytemora carolleeae]|eukprot:XP_023327655.1 pre-mRNA-splicing factor 18-like isoform X2 [Eurytemora affinis]